MSTLIKNVAVGKSSVDARLASTGVCSCIAMVIWPEDGTIFISHIDSVRFDVEAREPEQECIKLIKDTLKKFRKRKDNSSIKDVYIVGGLNNPQHERLHNAFNLLAKNHSASVRHTTELISENVRAFCRSIKYVNLLMNVDGEADGEDATASTFITDLTVLSDRTIDPPMLSMAQYFGTEDELRGGERNMRPWLIFIYDFALNDWYIADMHPRDHEKSSLVPTVLARFKANNPSDNVDLMEKAEKIINVLARIEDWYTPFLCVYLLRAHLFTLLFLLVSRVETSFLFFYHH